MTKNASFPWFSVALPKTRWIRTLARSWPDRPLEPSAPSRRLPARVTSQLRRRISCPKPVLWLWLEVGLRSVAGPNSNKPRAWVAFSARCSLFLFVKPPPGPGWMKATQTTSRGALHFAFAENVVSNLPCDPSSKLVAARWFKIPSEKVVLP